MIKLIVGVCILLSVNLYADYYECIYKAGKHKLYVATYSIQSSSMFFDEEFKMQTTLILTAGSQPYSAGEVYLGTNTKKDGREVFKSPHNDSVVEFNEGIGVESSLVSGYIVKGTVYECKSLLENTDK